MKKLFSLLFVFLFFQTATSQSITAKVIDANTGESIPYAGITLSGSQNLISNAEGHFTVSDANSNGDTVLEVSYLGYVSAKLTVAELKSRNNTVSLVPGVFELDNVNVTQPDPNSIMAQVKSNLKRNYVISGQPSKDKLFYREANSFKPKKLQVEFTKSTGFTKSALKKTNDEMNAFTSALITNPPAEYTDILCNYYNAINTKDGKSYLSSKMDVVKAVKLKDENRSASLEELQKSATNLFLKHLDTTKYYRIKSGLFGSRDTISLRKDFNGSKKKKTKKNNLSSSKSSLGTFLAENNLASNNSLDFVSQLEWYQYTYEGAMYSNENEFVYVLNFKPKKSKGKYVGKLYISETDYAVVRTDYSLAEGKKEGGVNLKFLLGIKFLDNVNKGTLIYKKNVAGTHYRLHYASVESGQYIYLNRPLKFIELADGEKDLLAMDLKVEGNTVSKIEFLNIGDAEITMSEFDNIKEEDFNYAYLKRYDPKIWKDHVAIEPLEEMKQFRAVE